MTHIPARPTTYKGIKMRSRLEARFAMQCDLHHEPWEYEPMAFANERGQYLPDFLLTRAPRFYVEVKPTLEAAKAACSRMEIIWDSEPDVTLGVVSGDGWCLTALASNREWWVDDFTWAELDW